MHAEFKKNGLGGIEGAEISRLGPAVWRECFCMTHDGSIEAMEVVITRCHTGMRLI